MVLFIKKLININETVSLEINIPYWSYLLKNIIGGFFRSFGLKIGIKGIFYDMYHDKLKKINRTILSDEEIKELISYEKKSDEYYKSKSKLLPQDIKEINKNSQRSLKIIPIIDEIMKKNDIKIIANIGCRVDFISCFFAGKYPKKNFLSVDVGDVKRMNQYLPQNHLERKQAPVSYEY